MLGSTTCGDRRRRSCSPGWVCCLASVLWLAFSPWYGQSVFLAKRDGVGWSAERILLVCGKGRSCAHGCCSWSSSFGFWSLFRWLVSRATARTVMFSLTRFGEAMWLAMALSAMRQRLRLCILHRTCRCWNRYFPVITLFLQISQMQGRVLASTITVPAEAQQS